MIEKNLDIFRFYLCAHAQILYVCYIHINTYIPNLAFTILVSFPLPFWHKEPALSYVSFTVYLHPDLRAWVIPSVIPLQCDEMILSIHKISWSFCLKLLKWPKYILNAVSSSWLIWKQKFSRCLLFLKINIIGNMTYLHLFSSVIPYRL